MMVVVESVFGLVGKVLFVFIVMMFVLLMMISYFYYGKKCFSYFFGVKC